jgi:8-oxo-dGTP pyrophosphatase MutT (NUDIX family)
MNGKRMYHGRVVDLDVETVILPNGAEAELEIVRHPGGAAAVAVDDRGRVCLLRQFRYAAGGWLWELPAGKLDPGETPEVTVARELEEEAGLRAARWLSLGRVVSSPGVFTEVVHLFLARDLSAVPSSNEAHELIEVHWLPFKEAVARVHAGDFVDGKTVIGLLRAQHVMEMGE